MSKTYISSFNAALLFPALFLLLFSTNAFANLPTSGKGGNDKKPNDSTRVTFSIPEREWVVVEVIEQPGKNNNIPVVNIEKKNISQVPFTKIEVRNCKQNNVPSELVPLMQQIPNGRKVYKSEENGKTVYYISPVQEPQQAGQEVDPSSLTFPLFWNMKI